MTTTDISIDTSGKTVYHEHSSDNLKFEKLMESNNNTISTNTARWNGLDGLPPAIYVNNPIGVCTFCEALADDADARLTPLEKPMGFKMVTRVKIGYGGFDPSAKSTATKSFRRSWQADKPGSTISFKFYGTTVKIAIWQRRDGMGVLNAYLDGDR